MFSKVNVQLCLSLASVCVCAAWCCWESSYPSHTGSDSKNSSWRNVYCYCNWKREWLRSNVVVFMLLSFRALTVSSVTHKDALTPVHACPLKVTATHVWSHYACKILVWDFTEKWKGALSHMKLTCSDTFRLMETVGEMVDWLQLQGGHCYKSRKKA